MIMLLLIVLVLTSGAGLSAAGLPNLPLPTLGGKQWWGDIQITAAWRIQQHTVTGHCRLLDARGVRRAWGSLAACQRALTARASQPGAGPIRGEVVICLHGLGRTRSMWSAVFPDLRAAGFTPVALAWPSTREDLPVAAARLRAVLAHLPEAKGVAFVTHSLGGPLLRLALAEPIPGAPPVRGAVFCFAPNQGAHLADHLSRWWLARAILGPSLRRLTHARAPEVPAWTAAPALVIAGGRSDDRGLNPLIPGDNDGVVAVADTCLAGAQHCILPVNHTFGIADRRVRARIVTWLADVLVR